MEATSASIIVGLWIAFCYYMMTRPATIGEGLISIKEEDDHQ